MVINGNKSEKIISSNMGGMMMLKLVEDWLKFIGEEWMTIPSIFNLLHKKRAASNNPKNNYFYNYYVTNYK